jgi:hypothetical protein
VFGTKVGLGYMEEVGRDLLFPLRGLEIDTVRISWPSSGQE